MTSFFTNDGDALLLLGMVLGGHPLQVNEAFVGTLVEQHPHLSHQFKMMK